MLNYQIELNADDRICCGEIFPANDDDDCGSSLLIGRNKWDGLYFVLGNGQSWTVGKAARELLATLFEVDSIAELKTRLGDTDEVKEEAKQVAWEEQRSGERERAAEEREAMAVIVR